MSDWQSVCIGDIASIPKKKPVANPQAIELLTVRLYAKGVERTGKYPRATERGRPYFAREAGEILIGRQNFHNGGVGIVGDTDGGLICSNAITSLVPNPKADRNFLFYLLSNEQFRKQIQRQSEGTGQSEISETKILSLEISLPPLPEQKKIAEILSGIDRRHSKLKDRINALSRVRIQLVREFLKQGIRKATDPASGLPQGWVERTLGEVSEFRRGSFPQPYGNPEWFDDAGFPFVQVYDIDDNGKLKPNTKTRVSQAAADKSVFIPRGSLIVSLQGSIGRVAVTQYDAYVDRTILIFTGYENILSREYFSLLVGDLFSRKSEVADGGVIKTITKQTLKEFFIRIPPLDEQRKMSEIVSNLDLTISLCKEQLLKGCLLIKSLANDLLSGRKRVRI